MRDERDAKMAATPRAPVLAIARRGADLPDRALQLLGLVCPYTLAPEPPLTHVYELAALTFESHLVTVIATRSSRGPPGS